MIKKIGDLIYEYRTRTGSTLKDIASMTGVSVATIYRIEADKCVPKIETAIALIDSLGLSYEDVLSAYLDDEKRIDEYTLLLKDAVARKNIQIIEMTSHCILGCSKIDTFEAFDLVFDMIDKLDDSSIKSAMYKVVIRYSRERSVAMYLAKALYLKYLIDREDYTNRQHCYIEGKELTHYMHHLTLHERITAYYRLGLQAYSLKLYDECLVLCKSGIDLDSSSSELKSQAVLSVALSYKFLKEYEKSIDYVEIYERFSYPQVGENARYLRAKIQAELKNYGEAIPILWRCLEEANENSRLPIANDLLNIFQKLGNTKAIEQVLENEHEYLPKVIDSPNKLDRMAMFYRRKGEYKVATGEFENGVECLLKSNSYYEQLGAYMESNEVIKLILDKHLTHGKELKRDLLLAITKSYNGCKEVT